MVIDILETLGFGDFDWWNSEFSDASNGWCPRYENQHVGISLNVMAINQSQTTGNFTRPTLGFEAVSSLLAGVNGAVTPSPYDACRH